VEKYEGERKLARSKQRWKNNIKMDFKEIGCDGVYWTDLAQDRENMHIVVKVVVTLLVPQNAGNFLTS
jgi:hypothetical protein